MGGHAILQNPADISGTTFRTHAVSHSVSHAGAKQIDLQTGGFLRVTIARVVVGRKARATLERLFMKDKAVASPLAARSANFCDKPGRRGGRVWVKRPNKLRPLLAVGDTAVIRAVPDHIFCVSKYKHLIFVKTLDAVPSNRRLVHVTQSVVDSGAKDRPILDLDRAPFTMGAKMSPDAARARGGDYGDQASRELAAPMSAGVPMALIAMRVNVLHRVLHWHLGDEQSVDVLSLIKSGEVRQVYVDREPTAATADAVFAGATQLFNRVATLRSIYGPVVVGPLSPADEELAIRLADQMISSTSRTFEQFCADSEKDDAFRRKVAERRAARRQAGGPPQPPVV